MCRKSFASEYTITHRTYVAPADVCERCPYLIVVDSLTASQIVTE